MKNNNNQDIKKLRNREEILNSAEEIIFKKGYDNSSMDEIAKKAGYTKKTLYNYFKSKEEIYYSIAERGYEKLSSMTKDVLIDSTEKSHLEKLYTMGLAFIEFYKQHPGYYKACFEFNYSNIEANDNDKKPFEMMIFEIQEGIKNGEIIDKDPYSIGLILWSFTTGIVNILIKKKDFIKNSIMRDADEVFKENFDIILKSIRR